jgi:hypothetical protein
MINIFFREIVTERIEDNFNLAAPWSFSITDRRMSRYQSNDLRWKYVRYQWSDFRWNIWQFGTYDLFVAACSNFLMATSFSSKLV